MSRSSSGSLSRYIVQRILLVIPMVWIILTLVFLVLRVAPGDPVSAALGGRLSQSALDVRRHQLGLDRPLFSQYLSYLGDVVRGRFGTTFTDKQQVVDVIKENGGATLTLTTASLLIALGIGIPLGRLSARFRDTPLDVGIRIFGIVTYAAPIFFIGLLAKLLFAVKLQWVDTSGMASPITTFEVPTKTHILLLDALLAGNMSAVKDVLSHLILPSVTLALLLCGVFIRLVRVNLLQTMQGDYVEAARARGISESRVIRKHAFRNALVPVVTLIGLQIALALSGAVLTEITFNWPGLGYKLEQYLLGRDYGGVQGIIVFYALVVVAISLLIDIVNAFIDPRVSY
jgi:peptide/nickel transport system permease protein